MFDFRLQAFYVVPEDEIIKTYRSARAALTPEQREFLMELMAADDAIIDTASRGIVDDVFFFHLIDFCD